MLANYISQFNLKVYIGIFVFLYLIICFYGSAFIDSGFHIKTICHGVEGSSGIALTFDDGPVVGVTDKVLDILKAHNVKATFFCIGRRVYENPELAKRIVEEGHIIASHTYHHSHLFDFYRSAGMKNEFEVCDQAIESATGKKAKYFRPPNGVTNPSMKRALETHNYEVVGWSVRSLDTVIKDEKSVVKRVLGKIKNGDIVLFHDSNLRIPQILESFLKQIRFMNIEVKELDQLINVNPYV